MPEEARYQDDVFLAAEGDGWFRRNRAALEAFDPDEDLPLRLVELYGLRPRTAVEIGAANGFRLDALAGRYGTCAVGVEASAEAVADGRARYPRVELHEGRIGATGLDGTFELVVVNFVFHWVDRRLLLASVAEVDRLVADGGFLLVGDFLPANRVRAPYHHLPDAGVHTYKQDYAATFLASGIYQPLCLLSGSDTAPRLVADVPERQRTGVWLLRKALEGLYVAAPTS